MSKDQKKWRVRDDIKLDSNPFVIGLEHGYQGRSDPYTIYMDPSDEKLYNFAGIFAIVIAVLMVIALIVMAVL